MVLIGVEVLVCDFGAELKSGLRQVSQPTSRWDARGLSVDRGKTLTKPIVLTVLGKASSEKQIPQVVENLENGINQKEALEPVAMRVKQAL
jgi:hypothetical protein